MQARSSRADPSTSMRRIRSTGDISHEIIRPIPLHGPQNYSHRYTQSYSDRTRFPNELNVPQHLRRGPQSAGLPVGRMRSPPPARVPEERPSPPRHHVAPVVYDPRHLPPPRQHNRSLYSKTMAFFGVGRDASRARRSLVSFLWNLAWSFVQIVVIITLLGISSHRESPRIRGLTEWKACDRPLGVWACLWVVRVFLAAILAYWGWTRDRMGRPPQDQENALPPTRSSAARTSSNTGRPTDRPSGPPPSTTSDTTEASTPVLPHTNSYKRLSLLSSLLTLSWFLTAHILEYTSVNTCRFTSPHLWWLVFGILCIMYLMVLEVLLLGFVVFIIAPILFLFWNILLICMGRHPLQNPTAIKPEIGKLPRSFVDRIPLVMYIPPPPEGSEKDTEAISVPAPVYSYPPTTTIPAASASKKRFKFLKVRKVKGKPDEALSNETGKSNGDEEEKTRLSGLPQTWEEHWEQGDYPFVRLEGNRAACAICLMDFEEPKRIVGVSTENATTDGVHPQGEDHPETGEVMEVPVENTTEQERDEQLRLEDAGEGAQPLRLLSCGHVFHKTCLDPWLIDVSGRCPVCQRPVELPDPPKKKKSRNMRRQSSV